MKIQFLLLFLLVSFGIHAQDSTTTNYARLPDKVYMHLDKNLYSPGDTIWTKAYVFHRNNLQLSNNSYSLHIQLLSQEGKELSSSKMLIVDGLGYGQMPLYSTMKPGFYQIIAHTGHMKNFGEQFFYKTTVEVRAKHSQMSIKSYFDKERYSVGDTAKVTFQVYDEFHMSIPKQHFRYDLKYREKSLKKGGSKSSDDGTVTIAFPITKGSMINPPCINLSYFDTHDLEDAKRQEVYVPMKGEILHLDFFPESGDLIAGVSSKVAFKGTDMLGEAVKVEGFLQEDGRDILQVRSFFDGMGFFSLTPLELNYTFRVTQPEGIDSVYTLPQVIAKGCHITFVKQTDLNVSLQVAHSFKEEMNLKLWISQYDKLLYVYDIKVDGSRILTIPKADLPQGLLTFTITNDEDMPMAERLVYIPLVQKQLQVSFPKEVYSQRKKVEVTLALDPQCGKAYFSAAVVDSILANSPSLGKDNIESYALLRSELRGRITNINSYLGTDRKSQGRCDLLLLTHGWRRYSWIYNRAELDSVKMLDFNVISGNVKRRRKPEINAQLTAVVMGDFGNFLDFKADSSGYFRLTPKYEKRQSQKLLLMAKSAKGKGNVNIMVYNTDTILFGEIANKNENNVKALVHDYNNFVNKEGDLEELPFLTYESKLLKELVVYGELVDPNDVNAIFASISAFSAGSLTGEELDVAYSFSDFVEQVSFRARYNIQDDRIIVKDVGGGSNMLSDDDLGFDSYDKGATIYLNGMSWGKDVSSLDFLTKDDIIQLIVLDPTQASQTYGSDGKYGVILVQVSSDYLTRSKNTINGNMTIFGRFIDSREYYKPVYETEQQDSLVVVDNRITLHWEPLLETDEEGKASFDFYTDDIGGTKQIVVQGIDERGHLYYETKTFNVQVVGY